MVPITVCEMLHKQSSYVWIGYHILHLFLWLMLSGTLTQLCCFGGSQKNTQALSEGLRLIANIGISCLPSAPLWQDKTAVYTAVCCHGTVVGLPSNIILYYINTCFFFLQFFIVGTKNLLTTALSNGSLWMPHTPSAIHQRVKIKDEGSHRWRRCSLVVV